MAEIVYALCALTSFACAGLLLRQFQRTRVRLVLWTLCCFLGLAINNFLLFIDFIVVPHVDLSMVRLIPALVGLLALVSGLIWDSV